ncbi:MAG: gliding motility lipoprotein GldJ [Bacteroidota bacterium]|nr:gliding motility lipoprotein GldJ [Bacteroidota bacterium]MEC8221433.1 gliding motility lipoprotein GldJ [Bacteroidota bacterium]|tara:strand:+ start:205 stop:1425 length:1221 start_codon:yes stop_codon:yes gene_type:complete
MKVSYYVILILVGLVLEGCSILPFGNSNPSARNPGSTSTTTNLEYFSDAFAEEDEEGFVVADFGGQTPGPNQVFVQGGRAVLGTYEEDVFFTHDNVERTVTVQSFYLDQTEIANIHWLEYLFYIQRDSSEAFYLSALPDTTVWEKELAYNTPYVSNYLRYPGFRYYPVVGVSWNQAVDYCRWRTEAVNKQKAIEYYGEDYIDGDIPPVESGVYLPEFRLPTEAEWEYAAYGQVGNQFLDENQTQRRLYPWDGRTIRSSKSGSVGKFQANFKRGRGDYAGIAGALNDAGFVTTSIYEYAPNDFGLYNMAGNVNEWVFDIYRPLNFQDMEDLNPIRKSDFLDDEEDYDSENFNSMISNASRVYKGGSWADGAMWLSPGTRRFLDQDSSAATIGFRCATTALGTATASN